jgi:hypothetical protein
MPVLLMLSSPCGCSEALVEDGDGRLIVCIVNDGDASWWCECADPDDPVECGHVDSLFLEVSWSI